jgi:homoserine O-acetyltransferase
MQRFVAAVTLFAPVVLSAQTKFAELGRCSLERGGVIEECRLAYRTFGTLSGDRRNAILIPTWFTSRVGTWLPLLGPTGVVDTTGFFVIIVESLGAGEGSSPATSRTQQGAAFPTVTVGDMVESQWRFVHDQLKLPELFAVVGISLGGMEAFEWGTSHPDYVRRIVPIEGGPRQGIHGRAMWEVVTRVAEDGARGIIPRDSALVEIGRLLILAGSSPADVNRRLPSTYAAYLESQIQPYRTANLHEWALHGRAILLHDIGRKLDGDLQRAAQAWRSKTFVVTSAYDHSVDPEPAQEFARLVRADTLVIATAAGHSAIFGDTAAKAAVRRFLAR